jgi:hypothetical protein
LKNQTQTKQLYKKLILKDGMQNPWPELWEWNKFIEKKLKIITKLIFKKKNKCRVIRSYKAESPTNQILKDKIKNKNQLHKMI